MWWPPLLLAPAAPSPSLDLPQERHSPLTEAGAGGLFPSLSSTKAVGYHFWFTDLEDGAAVLGGSYREVQEPRTEGDLLHIASGPQSNGPQESIPARARGS